MKFWRPLYLFGIDISKRVLLAMIDLYFFHWQAQRLARKSIKNSVGTSDGPNMCDEDPDREHKDGQSEEDDRARNGKGRGRARGKGRGKGRGGRGNTTKAEEKKHSTKAPKDTKDVKEPKPKRQRKLESPVKEKGQPKIEVQEAKVNQSEKKRKGEKSTEIKDGTGSEKPTMPDKEARLLKVYNLIKPCRLLIASGCCTENGARLERSVLECSSRICSQVGSLVGFSRVANQASSIKNHFKINPP